VGRRALTSFAALAALVGALALGAAPASAEYIHGPISTEFGPDGTSTSTWANANTLAYQQATKRLYILADNSIYGFSNPSAGTLVPLTGNFPISVSSSSQDSDIAVDNSLTASAGHIIYNADGPSIVGFDALGNSLGFTINAGGENCGVAVDNEGNIWGGTYGNGGSAQEWPSGGGAAITSIPLSGITEQPCKIGVDNSNNDVYPSGYGQAKVAKFTKASGYSSYIQLPGLENGNNRVEINATRHVVYVASPYASKVFSYDTATGSLLETFSIPSGTVKGLAVQDSTDTVFIASSEGKILELKGISVPKATTGEPVGNSTVGGTADADGAGNITECFFEFGVSNAQPTPYGSTKACDQSLPITQGESPKAVTASLPGLNGEETYHYRLVLGNANGRSNGVDQTITPHNVKGLKTEAATEITRTTAQLNGSFEGTNEPTTYFFEYGTTTAYGSRSPEGTTETDAGETTGPTPMIATLAGLQPDTTYHFRVVGHNPLGTSPGKDLSFKTPLAVQGVTTEGATEITRTSAVLHGSFTGNGENHTFSFEWGPTTAYGNVAPGGSAGNGTGKVPVSLEVQGLQVQLPTSQPYHYRLVATNSTGSTVGPDQTFITLPPELPVVSDESSEEVTPTGAKLNATINPGEGETVYVFEYGPDTSYGSATPVSESVGDDTSDHPVSSTLGGLTPGTIYHYRVVAYNYTGTTHGPDQTFTTPDVPRIDSTTSASVTRTTAHLSSSVSGNASPTNVYFEFGPTTGYGTSTASAFVGSSLLSAPVATDVAGLAAGTTYHFRAVAVNGIGTTAGPDQTFTTLPPEEQKPEEEKKCKRGFVKRHGKCVKKHRHNHRKHRRNG
jgi:hypothetical protein